jgi:hypothetical protein
MAKISIFYYCKFYLVKSVSSSFAILLNTKVGLKNDFSVTQITLLAITHFVKNVVLLKSDLSVRWISK